MSEGGRARGRGGRGRRPAEAASEAAPAGVPTAPAAPVGRGRSRGSAQAQKPVVQAPPPVPGPAATGPEGHIGGRGVSRGGGRERHEPPTYEMGEMSLGQGDYRRRYPWERFIDHRWKSETASKAGKSGRPREILSNYVHVGLPQTTKIYQYHVNFSPMIESIKIKCALVFSLSDIIGAVRHFDGNILFLSRLLPKDPMVCMTTRTYDNTKIEVTFKFTCEAPHTSPQFLQISNGLLKKVQSSLEMKLIKDHYYNLQLSVEIPKYKLEVMPGFSTAIGKFDGGTLMNFDIIHKILRVDTFLDCMYNLYSNLNARDDFQQACLKKYVGSIVMTRHNNKTYRVDDIDWAKRPHDTFEKGGVQVSYKHYYKEHWNLDIQDPDQPLLVTRPTERDVRGGRQQNLFLIPELCTITGLDDEVRSDFRAMADLAVHTRIGPEQRVQTLEKFLNQINTSPKVAEVLNPWRMTIGRTVLAVPARELEAEQLQIVMNRQPTMMSYDIKEADWSRSMRNATLLNPIRIENWLIIYPNKNVQQARDLSDGLIKVGKGMGMSINGPEVAELAVDRNEAYLQAIRQKLTPNTQIVVTVVSNNKKDRYDAIKKSCCIDNPVPSQVVVVKTLMKKQGLLSVATKIAIQMNCKMGGEVWGGNIPMSGLMVIGLDSYHDSLHKSQSVGAMVASLNKPCSRYYCKTEMHDSKVETMSNLSVLLSGALKRYYEVNGANPQKIVVYRDGVGDGQLKAVFKSEKEQLDQALRQAGGPDFKPGLAFVIVKKRIGTRLFAANGPRITNPQPGTIVDDVVTKSEWYDFFLVSQSVRQGTVTPTSYNVVFDTSGLQPDHIQRLTYKLTHLYFNWQGTIRVPAPCQYAHKLAFLQGQSLHREPSAHLADKLFFL